MIENGKIKNKLIYYQNRSTFDDAVENGLIDDSSVVFVEEDSTIHTHGHEFGGSGTDSDATESLLKQYLDDQLTDWAGRILDKANLKIVDMATKTYVDRSLLNYTQGLNITNTVKQILDAQEPSWTAIVERIGTLEGSNENILEQIARITASTGDGSSEINLESIYNRLDELEGWRTTANAQIQALTSADSSSAVLSAIYTRLTNLENSQNADETWKTETRALINAFATGDKASVTLEAIYEALGEDTTRKVAARIFAQANESGSSIKLQADRIDLTGDTSDLEAFINGVVTITDPNNPTALYSYLTANGLLFVDNTSTPHRETRLTQDDGLKHTITSGTDDGKHGYWLKPDGSGELAQGNISWDSNGNLTTHGLMLAEAEAMGAASVFVIDSIYIMPGYDFRNETIKPETLISYHILKSGFVIKYGQVRIDGSYFYYMQQNAEKFVQTKIAGTERYNLASENPNVGYTTMSVAGVAFNVNQITTDYIIRTLHGSSLLNLLNTPNSLVWNDIFKNDKGDWIFEDGESVYIEMPTYVYRYKDSSVSEFSYYVGGALTTDSYRIAQLNAKAEQLRPVIQQALETNGSWSPSWVYRYRGLYDENETYVCNDQYHDITIIISESWAGYSELYHYEIWQCVGESVTGVEPVADSSNWEIGWGFSGDFNFTNTAQDPDDYSDLSTIQVTPVSNYGTRWNYDSTDDAWYMTPNVEITFTDVTFTSKPITYIDSPRIDSWSNNPS